MYNIPVLMKNDVILKNLHVLRQYPHYHQLAPVDIPYAHSLV